MKKRKTKIRTEEEKNLSDKLDSQKREEITNGGIIFLLKKGILYKSFWQNIRIEKRKKKDSFFSVIKKLR